MFTKWVPLVIVIAASSALAEGRSVDNQTRSLELLSLTEANDIVHVTLKNTSDKPIIFAFHGYPWLIHRLTYRRTNHKNLHVRGYKEEGTTTTPFDMVVLNDLDRFHLVTDVIDRVPKLEQIGAHVKQLMRDKRLEHKQYISEHGDDMPEVRDWKWPY